MVQYLSVFLYFVGADCLIQNHNINGSAFSSYDRDNVANSANCAVDRHGALWYNVCAYSNLNRRYYGDARIDSTGITWYFWKNSYYLMRRASMKI